MAGSHEVPKIRVAVSPNMDVIGLSGEKLQSFYTPDPNINLEKIYDPRTYPTLRAFNAALEKEGAEGRIRTMTEGKVFEITHDPERTDEEALAYTHTMLGVDIIRMCDAGTGAIPILAIYAALCSDKVRCEALELNPNAAKIAQEVIKEFGLQDRIQIRQADATKFQPEEPLDFLVSETMHSGLTAEPIVQILYNLQPHVKDSGVTLPSRVNVQASLVSLDDYASPNGKFVKIYGDMHSVTDQEWQEVANYRPGDNLDKISFTLPTGDKPKGNYMVGVTCSVDVGSQHLAPYQSLITMPQYLRDPKSDPQIFTLTGDKSQKAINVQYNPGDTLEAKAISMGGLMSL